MKKLIFISASLIMIMSSCNQKSKLVSNELISEVDNNTKRVLELVRDHKFSIDSLTSINKLDSISISLIDAKISKKMSKLIIDNAKLNSDILNSNLDRKTSDRLLDQVHEIGLLCSYYIEYNERELVADGYNSFLIK